jgi:hypothetical protein
MDVSQILNLLATLSIGLDDPSDSDKAIYLTYINVAYTELLQETLSQNPFVPIVTDTLIPTTNGQITLSQFTETPFVFKTVYDAASNRPLTATNIQAIQKKDPGFTGTGLPKEWYFSGGALNIYPAIGSFFNTTSNVSFVFVGSTSFTMLISDNSIISNFFVGQNLQLSINATIYNLQIAQGGINTSVPNQITFTVTGDVIPAFDGSNTVSLAYASFSNIGITYIAQPSLLTLASVSEDIMIPALYQYILADGAAYYVFQSETGFRDQQKMQTSLMRWELGKQKLFAYLKNFGGQKYYSTYSPV